MEQHGQDGRRGGAARVAAILRDDIAYGRLRPGDRLPSTRQLVHAHGVAMATASRAVAMLRDEGLVVTRPGSGTTVRPLPTRPATARPSRGNARAEVVERAVAIADREGLHAVTMRRLAGELGMAPMSLYRHVAGREDLERLMLRAIFVASPLPSPPPESPRERLLGVYRLQWRLYRRHRWLATLTGVTRPPLVPEAMSHTERALDALADLGLPLAERGGVAIALTALVRGLALSVAEEVEAEHESRQRAVVEPRRPRDHRTPGHGPVPTARRPGRCGSHDRRRLPRRRRRGLAHDAGRRPGGHGPAPRAVRPLRSALRRAAPPSPPARARPAAPSAAARPRPAAAR
ncbi:GntR family transcriptional regulator [Actinotalea caeni]|uniref:GntR family transcriptional regulator n=1 Tax=Actinotalea caeni TaxID=1348467 RepID=UPI0039C89849